MRVEGVVQGVGFRPFVRNLAHRLGLAGFVGNDASGVFIEVEGDGEQLSAFLVDLEDKAPPLSVIDRVLTKPLSARGTVGFEIVASNATGERQALVSADTATCAECLQELFDPANRRYQYPFINCTNCGPRFTIVRDVPYDRPNTTMASFVNVQRMPTGVRGPRRPSLSRPADVLPEVWPHVEPQRPRG